MEPLSKFGLSVVRVWGSATLGTMTSPTVRTPHCFRITALADHVFLITCRALRIILPEFGFLRLSLTASAAPSSPRLPQRFSQLIQSYSSKDEIQMN